MNWVDAANKHAHHLERLDYHCRMMRGRGFWPYDFLWSRWHLFMCKKYMAIWKGEWEK